MILKTFWMSVWWLVHAIRNPSAHLPHILLRHHLQLLVLTSSTMKLVHFTNGKLFIFLVDIFFFKKGRRSEDISFKTISYFMDEANLIWSPYFRKHILFFFLATKYKMLHCTAIWFFKMLFKKLFSRSLSYGCISLTLPGQDQNDVVDMKKTHQWSNKQYPIK